MYKRSKMHLAKQEIGRNPMYYKSKMYQAKRDIYERCHGFLSSLCKPHLFVL